MFVREKTVNGYTYLYLVESVRENGRTKQRIIRNLGRKEAVLASGALDRLIASIGRFAERTLVLRAIEEGDARFEVRRIGAPLLFGRLWEDSGCRAVVSALVAGRGFGFEVERAVFVAVLHRLMVSGSDRSCVHWMADYAIPGADGLALHRFYRAMAWLGEEVEPAAEGALAPRCVKDLIEEALFERRRDLFSELGLVFVDTTSLSFEGAGGERLGAHGYSKDHRPDLKQMILAVVIDGEGRPVCTEMLAGNTSDSTVLLPVVDRLRSRFAIGRVCVVADRGMISAATIAALEEHGLEYILGTRERGDVRVRRIVLENETPFVPLLVERARGETQLFVKEVAAGGVRYIVCRNEAEAEKDRADRLAIVDGLQRRLKQGEKALIANAGWRRYLRRSGKGAAFEIDAGKLAEEARYDGIFVLRTNARITPLNAVLRYRELLMVDNFQTCTPPRLSSRERGHRNRAVPICAFPGPARRAIQTFSRVRMVRHGLASADYQRAHGPPSSPAACGYASTGTRSSQESRSLPTALRASIRRRGDPVARDGVIVAWSAPRASGCPAPLRA